ncbi:MAG: hypothetical protein SPG61_02305 [Arcanobacterium sp.]|nr:hypothetical protein [Arcanobacterium sp.]
MQTKIYKTLSKVVGIVLLIAGIGAFSGGKFAESFIAEQLGEQNIVMPSVESIDGQVAGGRLTEEDANALRPYADQPMTTGAQAKAFANHYVGAHMRAAAAAAGMPDATYATIGAEFNAKRDALIAELKALPENASADDAQLGKLADAEIANILTTNTTAQEAKALQDLRYDTMLDGNTLRGMLLNAYGWGLLGTIALYAGIALAVVGLLLTVYGFVPAKRKAEATA